MILFYGSVSGLQMKIKQNACQESKKTIVKLLFFKVYGVVGCYAKA